MKRVAVNVEGDTEERFVNTVLRDHLKLHGVEPVPIPIRGGINVRRLADYMARTYPKGHAVTSPVDFYAVTSLVDFYGFQNRATSDVTVLEDRLLAEIDLKLTRKHVALVASRVRPYVQLHEFEGLLFSDVRAFRGPVIGLPKSGVDTLQTMRDAFPTPEDINDSFATAPSRRIEGVVRKYRKYYSKPLHGPLLAEDIGLAAIRAACPRFNEWLKWLESQGP